MLYNQLFCLPSPETAEYLAAVIAGSALDIDMQAFKVEIMTSSDDIVADSTRVYHALPTSLNVWYDSAVQRSSLLLSLDSVDLLQRALELSRQGVAREWFEEYHPYLTIVQDMPPLGRHYRRNVRGIIGALVADGRPLVFGREYLVQRDLRAPVHGDYNKAMVDAT